MQGDMHRKLTFPECTEIAQKFAMWHVKQCGGVPDKQLFREHCRVLAKKYKDKATRFDLEMIEAYATAALRYDVTAVPGAGLWAKHRHEQPKEDGDAPTNG